MHSGLLAGKKIAVVAPDFSNSGGLLVLQDYIAFLIFKGVNCTVITPSGMSNFANIKFACPLLSVEQASHESRPSFDMLVFSWWESLFWASRVKADSYLCIAQSVEDFFPPAHQVVERMQILVTYLLRGIHFVSVSPWVQAMLQSRFGIDSDLVTNDLPRSDLWLHLEKSSEIERARRFLVKFSPCQMEVLVEGSFRDFKNLDEAIELADSINFKSRTLLFGGSPRSWAFIAELRKRGWTVLNDEEYQAIPSIYAKCDVLIRTSLLDSFGFAPLEMMASSGIVLVKPYQGAPGLCEDGYNSFFIENAADLRQLFYRNEHSKGELFYRVAVNGRTTAANYTGKAWQGYERNLIELFSVTSCRYAHATLRAMICFFGSYNSLAWTELLQHSAIENNLMSNKDFHSNLMRPSELALIPLRYKVADYLNFAISRLIPKELKKQAKLLLGRLVDGNKV